MRPASAARASSAATLLSRLGVRDPGFRDLCLRPQAARMPRDISCGVTGVDQAARHRVPVAQCGREQFAARTSCRTAGDAHDRLDLRAVLLEVFATRLCLLVLTTGHEQAKEFAANGSPIALPDATPARQSTEADGRRSTTCRPTTVGRGFAASGKGPARTPRPTPALQQPRRAPGLRSNPVAPFAVPPVPWSRAEKFPPADTPLSPPPPPAPVPPPPPAPPPRLPVLKES